MYISQQSTLLQLGEALTAQSTNSIKLHISADTSIIWSDIDDSIELYMEGF